MKYKLSMFNFDLPEKLIADTPAKTRDDSKLMVLHRSTGEIEHKKVSDLIDYFDDGDMICVNNTKVFPARLYANKEKNWCKNRGFFTKRIK